MFGYNNKYLLTHPHEIVRGVKNEIKYFIQRGRRGYSDRDVWSFDNYLARVIGDGTAQLRKFNNGHPVTFESPRDWEECLDRISEGFHAYDMLDRLEYGDQSREELEIKVSHAMSLFVMYFHNLWD